MFPPVQKTTWTRDKKAGKYYFHRFYEHQADLNTHHPAYREELYKIMGYWLQLGVSGFRMDAVPFLVERKGANVKPVKDFALLQEMRRFLQWRARDAILLAEANVPADESMHYFGDEGDRLQMMLNFPVNQRLYYAFATHDPKPLKRALRDTIAQHTARRAVGAVPAQPRRARPRPPHRGAAREGVQRVRPRSRHAALQPRHPAPSGADARQ